MGNNLPEDEFLDLIERLIEYRRSLYMQNISGLIGNLSQFQRTSFPGSQTRLRSAASFAHETDTDFQGENIFNIIVAS